MMTLFITTLTCLPTLSHNIKYSRLENSEDASIVENFWLDNMKNLFYALEKYKKESNGNSKINFEVLLALFGIDEFRTFVLSLRNKKIIKPLKKIFSKEIKDSYLSDLEKDLKNMDIEINPTGDSFIGMLNKKIVDASKISWKNLKNHCSATYGTAEIFSEEDETFLNSFVSRFTKNDDTLGYLYCFKFDAEVVKAMCKGNTKIAIAKDGSTVIRPKYLFFANSAKKELILQNVLERIFTISFYEDQYLCQAFIMENIYDCSFVLLIKKYGRWYTFSEELCEDEYNKYDNNWHVKLILYEKIISNDES